jgi:FixJ family two-component response regulator
MVSKKFHAEQRVNKHEDEQQNGKIADILHSVSNRQQQVLELLPRLC